VDSPQTRQSTKRTYLRLLAILLLALPLLLAGWFARMLFWSNAADTQTLAYVLTALDQGKPEAILQIYPPLPAILTLAAPSSWMPLLVAALAAGVLLWTVWHELSQTQQPAWVRAALMFALALSPGFIFLGTQSPAEMITLLLLLVAWRNFLDFLRNGATYNGFMVGLMLGLAFYASFQAVIAALAFALATPFFLQVKPKTAPAILTAMTIIVFPTLMALLTWGYLNWIFGASPFGFLQSAYTPVSLDFNAALGLIGRELLSAPLYLVVGAALLRYHAKVLPLYLLPLLLLTWLRTLGLAYAEVFVLSLCLLIALAALPRRASPLWGLVFAAAVMQVIVGFVVPAYTPEVQTWRDTLLTGQPQESVVLNAEIAARLKAAPDHSILADSDQVQFFIVEAGSSRTFLLPGDSRYELALSSPAEHVDYLLISETGGDTLAEHYGEHLPDDFTAEARWQGWTLYRARTAAPLLSKSSG
jgi:hypothetical protein